MSLVKREDMTKLRSAADSRATAQDAEKDQQLLAVAHLINQAANTGEYRVIYLGELLEEVVSELESQGYELKYYGDDFVKERQVIISWKE